MNDFYAPAPGETAPPVPEGPQPGMLPANSSPAERKEFYRAVPPFVRFLYQVTGKRQYARQFQMLFPGRPVPETV